MKKIILILTIILLLFAMTGCNSVVLEYEYVDEWQTSVAKNPSKGNSYYLDFKLNGENEIQHIKVVEQLYPIVTNHDCESLHVTFYRKDNKIFIVDVEPIVKKIVKK